VLPSEFAIPDPDFKRSTTNLVPATPQIAKKCRIPLGLVINPYQSGDDVPIIGEITRCRRCRSYINPFVSFTEAGRRWKCNMCFAMNDGFIYCS
jgi:protein transport protein SEC24